VNFLVDAYKRKGKMNKQRRVIQLSASIAALVVGVLVYLVDRQPANIYFVPDWLMLTTNTEPIFGNIGNHLPTFLHVFAFILLTNLIVNPASRKLLLICISWFGIEALFEIGQITFISQWIAGHVPGWWVHIPFLENTSSYFVNGTFDILDLVSITVGAVTAFLVAQLSQYGWKEHVA
jgi:hypothetical protein